MTDVSVIFPNKESLARCCIIINHSPDSKWINISKTARSLISIPRFFLVVLFRKVVSEPIPFEGNSVVARKLWRIAITDSDAGLSSRPVVGMSVRVRVVHIEASSRRAIARVVAIQAVSVR